jgi:hypothetical protein
MMSDEKFEFHGQTTFINRPSKTIIQNFLNNYLQGDGSQADQINKNLQHLIELTLDSKDLPDEAKEEVVGTAHAVAEQVRDKKANKLTLRGTLEAIRATVVKAADIAAPAVAIIEAILKIAGVS